MYKLKQLPEDFVVKEIFSIPVQDSGTYVYFTLKKRNITTLEAVQQIADTLRIPLKHAGFAGTKDKCAVAEQVCSAKGVHKDDVEKIKLKNIWLQFLGYGDKPISLGDHEGNFFKIVIRNITSLPAIKSRFVNFFGEQRFSTNNASIGKCIVKKDFKNAVESIQDFSVSKYLTNHAADYVGALKQLPMKQLRLYIHAYQAKLWNVLAQQFPEEEKLPLIGFGTEENSKVKNILEQEQVSLRDFIIKQIPELSSEGTERNVWAEATEISVSTLDADELNSGMKKVCIEFKLQKGCYATEFIRQSFE